MKMKPIKTRQAWTPEHNRELIDLYNKMLAFQLADEKYTKAPLVRALADAQGRTKGSIECKLMNVSAIRQNLLQLPIVKGYKALDNYNHDLADMVCNDNDVDYER